MADGIDTTPLCPKPPDSLIEQASRAVPIVLANVAPNRDGAVSLIALDLVGRLQEQNHLLAAAMWAVHNLVGVGMLVPTRIPISMPYVDGGFGGHVPSWSGKIGFLSIVEGQPAPFDKFQVVATEKLWAWWKEGEPVSREQQRRGAQPNQSANNVDPSATGEGG